MDTTDALSRFVARYGFVYWIPTGYQHSLTCFRLWHFKVDLDKSFV